MFMWVRPTHHIDSCYTNELHALILGQCAGHQAPGSNGLIADMRCENLINLLRR